jgi:hypothetical protein
MNIRVGSGFRVSGSGGLYLFERSERYSKDRVRRWRVLFEKSTLVLHANAQDDSLLKNFHAPTYALQQSTFHLVDT